MKKVDVIHELDDFLDAEVEELKSHFEKLKSHIM